MVRTLGRQRSLESRGKCTEIPLEMPKTLHYSTSENTASPPFKQGQPSCQADPDDSIHKLRPYRPVYYKGTRTQLCQPVDKWKLHGCVLPMWAVMQDSSSRNGVVSSIALMCWAGCIGTRPTYRILLSLWRYNSCCVRLIWMHCASVVSYLCSLNMPRVTRNKSLAEREGWHVCTNPRSSALNQLCPLKNICHLAPIGVECTRWSTCHGWVMAPASKKSFPRVPRLWKSTSKLS